MLPSKTMIVAHHALRVKHFQNVLNQTKQTQLFISSSLSPWSTVTPVDLQVIYKGGQMLVWTHQKHFFGACVSLSCQYRSPLHNNPCAVPRHRNRLKLGTSRASGQVQVLDWLRFGSKIQRCMVYIFCVDMNWCPTKQTKPPAADKQHQGEGKLQTKNLGRGYTHAGKSLYSWCWGDNQMAMHHDITVVLPPAVWWCYFLVPSLKLERGPFSATTKKKKWPLHTCRR